MVSVDVLLVLVLASVSVMVDGLGHRQQDSLKTLGAATPETFYIYPRTGRLFHADYVRDNQIFQSLERTNFMRRGPFAIRRNVENLENVEKYGDGEDGLKKDVNEGSGKQRKVIKKKVIPRQTIVNNTNNYVPEYSKRYRRSVTNEMKNDENRGSVVNKTQYSDTSASYTIKSLEELPSSSDLQKSSSQLDFKEENPVIELHTTSSDPQVHLQSVFMKKIVLDNGIQLYPVYKGINSPKTVFKRHSLEPSQIKLELPSSVEHQQPSITSSFRAIDEGRGKRRKGLLKKLLLPFLLALKMKTAIMLPLALGLISLVSFKGLWSGLTALGIAAALGLKALVGASAKVVVQAPHPPVGLGVHHIPPHEYAEYWSRRDDFTDYRPSKWL